MTPAYNPLVDAAAVSLVMLTLVTVIYAVVWLAIRLDDWMRRRRELREAQRLENEHFVGWWNPRHPNRQLALNRRGEVVRG